MSGVFRAGARVVRRNTTCRSPHEDQGLCRRLVCCESSPPPLNAHEWSDAVEVCCVLFDLGAGKLIRVLEERGAGIITTCGVSFDPEIIFFYLRECLFHYDGFRGVFVKNTNTYAILNEWTSWFKRVNSWSKLENQSFFNTQIPTLAVRFTEKRCPFVTSAFLHAKGEK